MFVIFKIILSFVLSMNVLKKRKVLPPLSNSRPPFLPLSVLISLWTKELSTIILFLTVTAKAVCWLNLTRLCQNIMNKYFVLTHFLFLSFDVLTWPCQCGVLSYSHMNNVIIVYTDPCVDWLVYCKDHQKVLSNRIFLNLYDKCQWLL